MDIRELDRRALALTGTIIAQIDAHQLSLPTPCPDWTVHGLVRHLVSQNEGFAAAAAGNGASLNVWRNGDLGSDPHQAYAASASALSAVLAEDDVLERQFALPEISEESTVPGHLAIQMHLVDYVVHAWDVAASIGVAWEPDDELVAGALEVAELVPDAGRGPGAAFDVRVGVPADAAAAQRLLGILGRDPSWQTPGR